MNARIEISAYQYIIYDPSCVNVNQGHLRSHDVTDLRLLQMIVFFLKTIAEYFGII